MNPLLIAWGLTLIAALFFLPVGLIRVLAAKRGATDYGQDMLNLGRVILGVGVAAAIAFIGLTLWLMMR